MIWLSLCILEFIGLLTVALGSLWFEIITNHIVNGEKSKNATILPSMIILIGAVIMIVSLVWGFFTLTN